MAFNTVIIEDEAPAAKRLQSLIGELEPDIRIVGNLTTVRDSVEWFKNNDAPDLVFMDIQLADDLSFSIFQQVDLRIPIIFTTAFDEYALQAFKVNSVDYLLKPIDKDDLSFSLNKWRSLRSSSPLSVSKELGEALLESVADKKLAYKSRFLVKMGDKLISVKIEDVTYFTSENKNTFLHTKNGKKFYVDETIEQLSEILDPSEYFRLNRKAICHLDHIANIHSYFNGKLKVYLHSVTEPFIVSREKSASFKRWLND